MNGVRRTRQGGAPRRRCMPACLRDGAAPGRSDTSTHQLPHRPRSTPARVRGGAAGRPTRAAEDSTAWKVCLGPARDGRGGPGRLGVRGAVRRDMQGRSGRPAAYGGGGDADGDGVPGDAQVDGIRSRSSRRSRRTWGRPRTPSRRDRQGPRPGDREGDEAEQEGRRGGVGSVPGPRSRPSTCASRCSAPASAGR